MPSQQNVSQTDRLTNGVAALSLGRERTPHQVPLDGGKAGYRVTLKPAANMVNFKFNREAILKASKITF